MAPKRRLPAPERSTPGYPSLHQHLAERAKDPGRRRFLGMAGASLAAGGLAACTRSMGVEGRADASVEKEPDSSIEILGIDVQPEYYVLRFPLEGDLAAWLMDGGYATFWVAVATWNEQSYQALLDNREDVEALLRSTLSEHGYEELAAPEGVDVAQDDLKDALEELCQEECGHQGPTLEAVTLEITYLAPEEPIGGAAEPPGYP